MVIHPERKYAFVHIPKTGGSYVTFLLKKYFEGVYDSRLFGKGGHGRSHSIPRFYSNWDSVIGLIRDPLTFYVSVFNMSMKDGKKSAWMTPRSINKKYAPGSLHPPPDPKVEIALFQNWLTDVLELQEGTPQGTSHTQTDWHGKTLDFGRHLDMDIGLFTRFFVMQYMGNDYGFLREKAMPINYLLRMEHVHVDLAAAMEAIGYDTEEFLKDINNSEAPGHPAYQSKRNTSAWRTIPYEDYYTPELIELVKHKDRFIYYLYNLDWTT